MEFTWRSSRLEVESRYLFQFGAPAISVKAERDIGVYELAHQDAIEIWLQRVAEATQFLAQQYDSHSWLLKQTVYTHLPRLATLLAMPWFHDLAGYVLDVGSGTGALSLDLAWKLGAKGQVTAIDRDVYALKIAQSLAGEVGVEIRTLAGEAVALPVMDATQDTTVARFLFQHLPDPLAALHEMRRVTRKGGRIAIFDVDDGVKLCEPSEPDHLASLYGAIGNVQSRRGGDRMIGRKLYRLLIRP
jgi:ubiquinone/menaquinone biosynthesis C-methylase UbiE